MGIFLLCNRHMGLFLRGIKRQRRESDNLLYLIPRLRKCEVIPPLPQYVSMAWYLVKHRGKFAFTLNIKLGTPSIMLED
jgi:hypothetical protein